MLTIIAPSLHHAITALSPVTDPFSGPLVGWLGPVYICVKRKFTIVPVLMCLWSPNGREDSILYSRYVLH